MQQTTSNFLVPFEWASGLFTNLGVGAPQLIFMLLQTGRSCAWSRGGGGWRRWLWQQWWDDSNPPRGWLWDHHRWWGCGGWVLHLQKHVGRYCDQLSLRPCEVGVRGLPSYILVDRLLTSWHKAEQAESANSIELVTHSFVPKLLLSHLFSYV